MIKASAPGRAGIIGNPTDGYGGSVISCAIAEQAYVTIEKCDKLVFEIGNEKFVTDGKVEFNTKNERFLIPEAILNYLNIWEIKMHLKAWSDIPFQAGLAGSTAMLVASLNAILKFLNTSTGCEDKYHMAEMARTIELNYMKIQCGYQDQYMTTFGGLNYIDFRDKEQYRQLKHEIYATVEPLHLCVKELPFVLVHTGVRRVSGSILKPIRDRWMDGDMKVILAYEKIAHICRQGKKALLNKDWIKLGALMNQNHRIQQELGASGKENDRLIEIALKNGALGAKLAGAGGGGTIIALHPKPDKMIKELKLAGANRILFLDPGKKAEVTDTEDRGGDKNGT